MYEVIALVTSWTVFHIQPISIVGCWKWLFFLCLILCSLVDMYSCCRGTCYLCWGRWEMMMEVISSAETSVHFYQTTRCYVPPDANIHSHCSNPIKIMCCLSINWWKIHLCEEWRKVVSSFHNLDECISCALFLLT